MLTSKTIGTTKSFWRAMSKLISRGWHMTITGGFIRLRMPGGRVHRYCPITAVVKEATGRTFSTNNTDSALRHVGATSDLLCWGHSAIVSAADNPRHNDREKMIKALS